MNYKIKLTSLVFAFFISASLTSVFSQETIASIENGRKLKMTQLEEELQVNLSDSLINYAYSYLNTPYRLGANGTKNFDCSGFSSFVFRHFGYDLTRTAQSQSSEGVEVKRNNIRKGDLVFFKGRNAKQQRVGHVGIIYEVFEDGTFSFIHASVKYGVTVTAVTKDYYSKRLVTIRRILEDKVIPPVIEKLEVNIDPIN